jgi:hypothetical protein
MATKQYSEGGVTNGNEIANAHGSLYPYLAHDTVEAQVTSLLENEVYKTIFDTVPEKNFESLRVLMFDKTPTYFGGEECSWYEHPDQRINLIVDNGVAAAGTELTAAQTPAAGAYATANIPVDQVSYDAAGINKRLHFKSTTGLGGWAMIVGKTAGTPNTLQVRSLVGVTLPAIIQGASITMGAELRADGERRIVNHYRTEELKRANFITWIINAREYGRREWLKWNNAGTTNHLDQEKMDIINATKFDALIEMWNGNKAPQVNDNGKSTKGTDGIKTQMINGGVSPVQTTMANFVSAHEALSFATSKRSSGVTYNIANEELLYQVQKAYKEHKVRYEPKSRIADLGLDAIRIGGRTHVFIPSDLFNDDAYFPGWGNHYFMLDKSTVEMAGQKGMPYLDINNMLSKRLLAFFDGDRGSRDDLYTWPVEACFGVMVKDPARNSLLLVGQN